MERHKSAEGGAGAEDGEDGEDGEPVEPVEPIEPVAGGSPASQPEEILLSGPADEPAEDGEDGEDGEPVEPVEPVEPSAGGDAAQAARPMAEGLVEEASEPAQEALEVVTGEGPEIVEQFGTIEDAGSPHNHAEGT